MNFFTLEITQDRTQPVGTSTVVAFTLDFTTGGTVGENLCVVLKATIPSAYLGGTDSSGTVFFQVMNTGTSTLVSTFAKAVVMATEGAPLPVVLIDSVGLEGMTDYNLQVKTTSVGGECCLSAAGQTMDVSIQGNIASASSPNGFPTVSTEINVNNTCPA